MEEEVLYSQISRNGNPHGNRKPLECCGMQPKAASLLCVNSYLRSVCTRPEQPIEGIFKRLHSTEHERPCHGNIIALRGDGYAAK